MKNISILSASVRHGRNSHRVALYFKNYLEENKLANVTIIDLKAYNFPIFEERLRFISDPSEAMLSFAEEITKADGVIIVTPEYNGGYPASLKNVTDLLYAEWKRKPIAIATVSAGAFAGTQVITSLQFSLWKIGALTIPAMFPVATVEKTFDENGIPSDPVGTDKRAAVFVNELLYWVDAKHKMDDN
ncbi:NADPH-dependent FMN reductase [Pedobacter boryungensis]|uniref:NAD(P)H-dependent oxidoreductase n=1 Tax=Pedobacter boryungensis TaxID=869962 RepID=A0ABX2DFJ9_9SPHI|nr:NAD(P)H-dependent oxidoreductase [Pedobacter boryungensis]NQX32258.1 NAD(P)H-dependent oxidoreductase [Pedobacter boryungensis]